MLKFKVIDQIFSASSSYLPLLVFVAARDFEGSANCSIVFSFYFFVLSMVRVALVSVAHADSKLTVRNINEVAKTTFLVSIIPAITMIIFANFTTDLSFFILCIFALGILAAATTEIYRLALLNEDKTKNAIILNLSVMLLQFISIIFMFLIGGRNEYVLVIWALSFIVPVSIILLMRGIPRNFLETPKFLSLNFRPILVLILVPLISLVHSIIVNLILILTVGLEGLGVFRSVLLFFLPLNFTLNLQTILYLPHLARGRNHQAFLIKRNFLIAMFSIFIFSFILANFFFSSKLPDFGSILFIGILALIPAASNLDFLRLITTFQLRKMIVFRIFWLLLSAFLLAAVKNYHSLIISILMLCCAELCVYAGQMVSLRKAIQKSHE